MPAGRPKGYPKSGGRVKGTPNKSWVDVAAILAAVGCDPIAGMAEIAMNPDNSMDLRARMYAELAGYVAPKRKTVDVSSQDGTANTGTQHEIVVRVVKPDLTPTDDVVMKVGGKSPAVQTALAH